MEFFKEVFYDQYCKTCKHKDIAEEKDPCNECLERPVMENSHKPFKYEEKE